ncbi:hypothetical protein RHGRI_001647 [Rhododendron griersonianum]|uniref:Uncharacterized protein n=1 Tax=Rhododendron griersonianum TaxID=479676 RepID=A0AAV6LM42_9ERIC|nr:hypothetical protein RHGRI_001647 [Rhododendron griersonianum]
MPIFTSSKENRSNTISPTSDFRASTLSRRDTWVSVPINKTQSRFEILVTTSSGQTHSGGSCSRPSLVRPSQADGNRAREPPPPTKLGSLHRRSKLKAAVNGGLFNCIEMIQSCWNRSQTMEMTRSFWLVGPFHYNAIIGSTAPGLKLHGGGQLRRIW